MPVSEPDCTATLIEWLGEQFSEETVVPVTIGLSIGVALAMRHAEAAEWLHRELTNDYKIRGAGSLLLFEAMGVAAQEERTGPEKIADEIAQEFIGDLEEEPDDDDDEHPSC